MSIQQLLPLSESERLDARDQARQYVIRRAGAMPNREDFNDSHLSEYPAWLTRAVAVMLVIVFLAAASISTFRLYAIGRDYFLEHLPIMWQAAWVGGATAILAEFLVITSASAMTILFTGRARWLAALPILLGLSGAFIGNHEVTQAAGLWGWWDTIAPPLAVLSTGVMGERVLLLSLAQRRANELAYQQAFAEWQRATADPERSPEWQNAYANALREQLRTVNSKGSGKTERVERMGQMNRADWRALVWREMQADQWFAAPVEDDPVNDLVIDARPQLVTVSSNGNGHRNGNGHYHGN